MPKLELDEAGNLVTKANEKILKDIEVEIRTELLPEDIKEPPRAFGETLRALGPTFILAGAIVGSGELIATTLLGAKVGFIMLWAIIISCLAKVMIQEVVGRYIIATGKGLHEMLDEVPGPKIIVSWAVWWSILLMISLLVVMAGIFGSQGLALKGLFGGGNANIFGVVAGAIGIILLYRGIYGDLEKIVVTMVVGFSLITTFLAFIGLQFTPYPVTGADIASGLSFKFPAAGVAVALSVFGMTGLSANEIIQYTYWAKGKGYAAWTGPKGSPGWEERMKGWVRIMRIDLGLAAITYTLVTIAFYVIGAAVLNRMNITPGGFQLVDQLANMYTKTLGTWSNKLFMLAAFVVLYSTYVVNTAGISRVVGDGFIKMKLLKASSTTQILFWRRVFLIVGPVIMFILYYVFPSPAQLVVIGGMLLSLSLPIISLISLYINHKVKQAAPEIALGPVGTFILWLSAIVCVLFVVAGYIKL
ncbi:MAG: Nramp family divalent metal transporter [Desulfitobacterium hafniense]|nr:Nramp family divalent metal transporter [Desulfitobacterium hafniense]